MLTLTLLVRRNLGVIAFALIVVAFVAVIAGVALTPARGATPLGDPNAAVVEPTIAPPDSLPPVARPAAVPVSSTERIDTSGGVVEIDPATRRPDPGVASRIHAAVACAAGRDLIVDPALDAAAADLWYVETVYNGDFNRLERVARERNLIPKLKRSMLVPGIVAAQLNHADPCIVGDVDLRYFLTASDFDGIDAAGVAFFPMPGFEQEPVSSFMLILLDVDPPSTK
jgi:hypothetical protein